MVDLVVTVPKAMWFEWIEEGDLPGEEALYESHFWVSGPMPISLPGERIYIVAHGKLRGYAPLVRVEQRCILRPSSRCLVREGGAVAVTVDEPIRGFQGARRRWWERDQERPFPTWRTP